MGEGELELGVAPSVDPLIEYDVTQTDVDIRQEVPQVTDCTNQKSHSTSRHAPTQAGMRGHASVTKLPASLIAWRLASALLVACESTSQSDIVAFDLETTGLNPRYDSAVELAAQRLQVGANPSARSLTLPDEGFEQLVNPGRSITQGAIEVHGIYPQQVREAPHVYEALPDYLNYLGDDILLGHNVGFDMRFLHALSQRAG